MDLTKVKLQTDEGCTASSVPLYLLVSGTKKLLATGPVLKAKRRDLYVKLREKNPPTDTGVKIGGVKIYRVHPNRLSRKQRLKLVGHGEQGKLREDFLEDGLTAVEQRHRGREVTQMIEVEWSKESRVAKRARRKANRSRSDFEAPEETDDKQLTRFVGVGVKEVAKEAELEPVEIRKFLRAKQIGKRGGRYAFTAEEAKKIARAARKHYA